LVLVVVGPLGDDAVISASFKSTTIDPSCADIVGIVNVKVGVVDIENISISAHQYG
jgi:hypothetical protein